MPKKWLQAAEWAASLAEPRSASWARNLCAALRVTPSEKRGQDWWVREDAVVLSAAEGRRRKARLDKGADDA